MSLLPQVDVFVAFAVIIGLGGVSVLVHDWIERGMRRRAKRLRGER